MTPLETVALILVFCLAVAWYLSYTAARLHRLQTRVEGALAALDAHLVRRAEAAVELANAGCLDPATALVLASAASESLDSKDTLTQLDWQEGALAQRESIESALTEVIREALDTLNHDERFDVLPGPGAVERVTEANKRAQLARRFYNDAVFDVQRVRRNLAVRVFHLAGYAAIPRTVEFDDDLGAASR